MKIKGDIFFLLVGLVVCYFAVKDWQWHSFGSLTFLLSGVGLIFLSCNAIYKHTVHKRKIEWMVRRAFAKTCCEQVDISIPTESVQVYESCGKGTADEQIRMMEEDKAEEGTDVYGCLTSTDRGTVEGKVYVNESTRGISVCIEVVSRNGKYSIPEVWADYPNRFKL